MGAVGTCRLTMLYLAILWWSLRQRRKKQKLDILSSPVVCSSKLTRWRLIYTQEMVLFLETKIFKFCPHKSCPKSWIKRKKKLVIFLARISPSLKFSYNLVFHPISMIHALPVPSCFLVFKAIKTSWFKCKKRPSYQLKRDTLIILVSCIKIRDSVSLL